MRSIQVLLTVLLIVACRSEPPKYKKSAPVQTLHAGQYVVETEGGISPYTTERYVLSLDGSAEWHILKKRGRYGDFYLDQIHRGQWEGLKDTIRVRFETEAEKRSEVYDSILLRSDVRQDGTTDTLWVSRGSPGRALKRIAAFR